jgi:hypothetical protein
MSSDAAPAAAPRTPAAVIARILLYEGAIVRIKVPARAIVDEHLERGEATHFLRFPYYVRGGVVNCFLHAEHADETRGQTITASVSLLVKKLDNRCRYYYLRFQAVAADPTHRLLVASVGERIWTGTEHLIYETPSPLEGIIVFTPRSSAQSTHE